MQVQIVISWTVWHYQEQNAHLAILLTGQSSDSSLDFGEDEHQRKKPVRVAPPGSMGDTNESVEHRLSSEWDSRKTGMKIDIAKQSVSIKV